MLTDCADAEIEIIGSIHDGEGGQHETMCIANIDGECVVEHCKGEIHSMDRHSTLSHQQAAADYEMIQDAFLYYFGRKEGEQHERVD